VQLFDLPSDNAAFAPKPDLGNARHWGYLRLALLTILYRSPRDPAGKSDRLSIIWQVAKAGV